MKAANEYKDAHTSSTSASDTPGNIEYLFNKSSCKPCFLNGLCPQSRDDSKLFGYIEQLAIQPRPLQRGDYLFRQGDKLLNIYVIRSGGVKVLFNAHDGTEQILNFYLRGGIIGLSDIESGIHGTSAIALDTTGICKLPYDRLMSLSHSNNHLYDQLFKMVSRQLTYEHMKMVLLGQKQSEERFASFILEMATRNNKNGHAHNEFDLSMSRHDIANYLCLADETISRLIAKFSAENLLLVDKRSIRICNLDKLGARAGINSNSEDRSRRVN